MASPAPVERSQRSRSFSTTSRTSTTPSLASPLARRSTRPPLALSPIGSFVSSSASYRGGGGDTSFSFSAAASNFGSASQATVPTAAGSTAPGGVARFKRAHARGKNAPVGVRTGTHPDDVDLGALEDPDEVFRLFNVRDVRGLEKRASDAAAAKVSELRIMVGERYRDLLSAADSIIRMRVAADKLVEHMDRIDSVVAGVTGAVDHTPSKRGAPSRQPRTPEPTRTLASPPTLSLTIHLLLSLPSLVHSLLDTSSFLPAARLEGVGRVVYRELSTFSYADEDEGALLEAFPIIERQWESIGSLGVGIVRRATEELRVWDTSPLVVASTLAAVFILDDGTLPSSLSLLLDARTESLAAILDSPPHKSRSGKPVHEIESVLANLGELLGLVLRTVEAATEIFGTEPKAETDGLLVRLLKEIENPSANPKEAAQPPQLVPILSTLPNYPLLSRHLPPSILSFTPFLSISSARNALSTPAARTAIQIWLESATTRVVQGVKLWISELRGGARTLASVRAAIRTALEGTGPAGTALQQQLEDAVESRLESVYASHLSVLADRVEPCLRSLLDALPTSLADTDPAKFLFETPLAFPPPSYYVLTGRVVAANDPFDSFLEKVMKRVEGRPPLLDKGVAELEAHARDLKEDLAEWLGVVGPEHPEAEARSRLRKQYIVSAQKALDNVFATLSAMLDASSADVTQSLFLGNFAFALSLSKPFVTDLLLGSTVPGQGRETAIATEWQARLKSFQSRSLLTWRVDSVRKAIQAIEESTKVLSSTASFAEDSASTAGVHREIPNQPSAGVLSALRILVSAVRQVGPHRIQADPTINAVLLAEFQEQCLSVLRDLVKVAEALDERQRAHVAMQAAWDVAFLGRFWSKSPDPEWRDVEKRLLRLSGESVQSGIELATLQYLQRTQTVFAPLLPPPPALPLPGYTSAVANSSRLLPWGTPPTVELKSVGGIVPGSRLNLLPTR